MRDVVGVEGGYDDGEEESAIYQIDLTSHSCCTVQRILAFWRNIPLRLRHTRMMRPIWGGTAVEAGAMGRYPC